MLQPHSHTLFIGDSITDAFRRPEEPNDAYQMGNGYAFLIASLLLATRPDAGLRFSNRGKSGNGIRDLEARWDEDCLALRPDCVSILIGVNETLRRFGGSPWLDADEYESALSGVLARTREALPDVKLVLCEPFLLEVGIVQPHWHADMDARREVVRRLATRCNAVWVPFAESLEAAQKTASADYWAYDGIHPSAAGHYLLAQTWLQTLELL